MLVPLAVLVFWLGLYPAPALDIISTTMGSLLDMFEAAAAQMAGQ